MGLESIDSTPDWVLKAVHYPQVIPAKRVITFYPGANNISDQAPCVDGDTIWEYKVCLIDGRGGYRTISSCSEEAVSEQAIVDLSITILDSNNPACFPRNASVVCSYRAVYEGSDDFALRCRVTNEPPGATYTWSGTDIDDRLSVPTGLRPIFHVPDDVDGETRYNYTVTLSVDGYDRASGDALIIVKDRDAIGISCAAPDPVYEGAPDFALSCQVTSRPSGARYSWSSLGNASDTELLSATDILSPTFYVPDAVDTDTDYLYRVRLLARDGNSVIARSADVTVTVKDRPDTPDTPATPAITVACADSPYDVDEGDSDIALRCDASGGPDGSTYTWSWSPTARLTDHDTATPVFAVPSAVDTDTNYEYRVTATAQNAGTGVADVIVRVRDTDLPVPVVSCADSEVYEGSADFDLRCTVRNEPSEASYRWSGTDADNRLSSTTELRPTFLVPEDVDTDTDYEYTVTLSGSGVASVEAAVTVTVLNAGALRVVCASPASVYEGSEDIAFDCEASGAPAGSDLLVHEWAASGQIRRTRHCLVLWTFLLLCSSYRRRWTRTRRTRIC